MTALLTAGAVSLVALQGSSTALAQTTLPAEVSAAIAAVPAEPYVSDLALALGATSAPVRERAGAVVTARTALARVLGGFGLVAEASPTLEFERDLADPAAQGAWGTDIDLSVSATYRRDSQAVTRARMAVAAAETRLSDQLRDDLQRSLLALSGRRLAERSLDHAVLAAAEADAALREAEATGASAEELMPLRVARELATNAVERELAELAAASTATTRLGHVTAVPTTSTLLGGADRTIIDLAPSSITRSLVVVPTPEQHARARILALELALARSRSNATAFTVLRELDVYGAYENAGFEVEGRAGLAVGVPVVGSTVSWTNGSDDVGFVVGLAATLRLTDASASDAAAAARGVSEAQVAYAGFLDTQVDLELTARRAAELEFEDFALTALQLTHVEAQVVRARATSASEREVQRLATAHRRAQDATEHAWQRYVRSLVNYLGVVDATWRTEVMEER